ncbi:MAG: TolC family protein [Armatimonadetes bacterium]|nr:TolC family protein [Armatimonadota bacterium]
MRVSLWLIVLLFLAPAGNSQDGEGVLTLVEAARQAVSRHPDLAAARGDLEAGEARAIGATAPYYPVVTASAGRDTSRSSSDTTGGLTVIRSGTNDLYSAGFQARQRLLDFGQTRSQVVTAEHRIRALQNELEDTLQQTIFEVVQAYFQVQREAAAIEINLDNVRNAEVQLQQALGFWEAGTRARIEVTRAEADVATARLGLIRAENAEKKARLVLGTAMGLAGSVQDRLAQESLAQPDWDAEEAYALARGRRPDLLAADAQVAAARSAVNEAAAQYRPTIDATGSYFWRDDVFPPEQFSWSVGVDLQVPVFNEPALGAAVGEAEANLAATAARRDALALDVNREVGGELLSLREAQESLQAAAVATRAAEESHFLASERYKVGVGSSIEVSEAQRVLVQARSQELQARFDLQIALARLYRSTGTLTLDFLDELVVLRLPPAP